MGLVGSELGLDRGTNGFEGVLDGATEAADHEFGANGGDPVGVALDLDGEAGREFEFGQGFLGFSVHFGSLGSWGGRIGDHS